MRRMREFRHSYRRETRPVACGHPQIPSFRGGGGALLRELQMCQQRLVIQNESLRRTPARLADPDGCSADVYDLSPVGYLTLTAEGAIARINPTCAEILGLPREQVLNRPFRDFVQPDWQARIDQLTRSASTGDRRLRDEIVVRRNDGSGVYVELVCRRMSGMREPGALLVALTDLSERKEVEQQLRIAATVFEAQEGMIVLDSKQLILRVNGAFTDITGYSNSESLGQTLHFLDAGRHDESFYGALWNAVKTEGFWQGEIWSRRKNGEIFPEWRTITAIRNGHGGISHYVGTITDNTARNAEEAQIKHLAFYDSLTQLPNRQYLLNRLQQAIAASTRSGREGALLFIDLDNFKRLNDTLGHGMGDLLLQQVAWRLSTCVREGDTVARLGGDEFVVMLENLSPDLSEAAAQIEAVGEKILGELNKTYDLNGHPYHSTPSIGATLFNDHRESIGELLKAADMAMYHAKAAGRNVLRFFDDRMQAAVSARLKLEAELRASLQHHSFVLHYQTQVDRKGYPCGAEALLRWYHLGHKLLSPAEFMSLAEDTGLLVPIGQWGLETACRQLKAWSRHRAMAHLSLSVNFSTSEFQHPDFVKNTLATIARHGTNPDKVYLELTEHALHKNVEESIEKLAALKSAGIRIALDNFGHGATSLANLRCVPVDRIKLGPMFIRNLPHDAKDMAIAQSIVVLGNGLGLDVVANGIETGEQWEAARQLGFRLFQGFLFGQPRPPDMLGVECGGPSAESGIA